MNNYERIKNMSIDEMAEFFNRSFCQECGFIEGKFEDWKSCNADCWANNNNGYYKKWLESEVL